MADHPTRRGLLIAATAFAALPGGVFGCRIEEGFDPLDTGDTGDTDRQDTGEDGPPLVDFDPVAILEDAARFPEAVQAGAMRQESVLLSTFVAGTDPVSVMVWQESGIEGQIRLFVNEPFAAPSGQHVKAAVQGLTAGEWFSYAFFHDDGSTVTRSLIGRFRAALPEGSREPLTLAMSACNGGDNAPWPALIATAEHDYDLFVHLGDMAYNDGSRTLEEYRESWHGYLVGDGFRKAYAKAGLYAVWDDHEFTNDMNPELASSARVEAAKTAFFESVAAERTTDGRLWQSYRWGDTAEIFLLDCRSERRPSTLLTGQHEYISPAQMAWLKQALADSTAHFKVVLNSVPITNMPLLWDAAAYDRWEGYSKQRDELLGFIDDEDLDNVWFLAGDFHVCFAARIDNGEGRVARTWEIACTGGNTNVLGDALTVGPAADRFAYGTSQPRATLLTFDPVANTVHVKFVDPEDGSVDWEQTLFQS